MLYLIRCQKVSSITVVTAIGMWGYMPVCITGVLVIIIIYLFYTPLVMIPGLKAKLKTDQWHGYMTRSSVAAKKALIKNDCVESSLTIEKGTGSLDLLTAGKL